jgi:hypothetical protein
LKGPQTEQGGSALKSMESEQSANRLPAVNPRLASRTIGSTAAERVPEPDAIRPESSPEWRELFKHIRVAVDRLRE